MLPPEIVTEITAYATLVTAIATGALAYLTYRLAWESRSLRKASAEPRIVSYLEPHPDGHGGINFVLANYGMGPAFEVQFTIKNDAADFESHDVLLRNDPDRGPLTVIPQGGRIAVLFGVGYVLFGAGEPNTEPLKAFEVTVQFRDIEGRSRATTFKIDIKQFSGLAGLANKPPLLTMSQSLEKIEGHLSKLGGTKGLLAQLVDVTKISDTFRSVAKGGRSTE